MRIFPGFLAYLGLRTGLASLGATLLLGCGATPAPTEQTATQYEFAVLAPGFSTEPVIGNLELPTAMRFAPDGRIYVAEKSGLIKVYSGAGAAPVTAADLRTEVMDFWDRGLLDIAINPGFPAKPYIYALYSMDGKLGDSVAAGTVPRYHDGCGDAQTTCPIASHLDRIVVDPVTGVMVSKTTLIENWGNQYPSHGIGSLQWGPDGYLYVSSGDGASFNNVDYGNSGNPLGDPPNASAPLTPPSAQGGALRSQIVTPPAATPPFPTWFNGKVLRVDPETMTPLLDPYTVPAPPPIVAKGLRNPFRMTFRGATSELWIGDVGWDEWEEIDRISNVMTSATSPMNFGWPCYEGNGRQGGYEGAGLSICQSLYNTPNSVTGPHYSYPHMANVAPGDGCGNGGASISGLAFYDGASFPAQYQGALFFSDYARQCTWYLPADANGLPSATGPVVFAQGAGAPVQLTVGPDGDLYYVDIQGGSIGRFHYTTNNHAPLAVLSASAHGGLPPFPMTFDASASTDVDVGDTLSFAWDLDGDDAFDYGAGAIVTYTYTTLQNVTVKVKVTDSKGASSIASTLLTVGNAPVPSIQLLSGANWSAGDVISVAGAATDTEDGALGATAFDWSIILQHCPQGQACHAHVLQDLSALPQVSVIGPDHDYPAHIEIVLTATDSDGLSASTTLSLNPATTDITLTTDPPGLRVALNQAAGAAPLSMTVIRGALSTVSAPDQSLNGTLYSLSNWSDGGAATHGMRPTQATLALTANYTAIATEQNLTDGATPIALITAPAGGGSRNLGIIKDGVKPAVGSADFTQQYDTFDGGGARATDWVGYTIPSPKTFMRIVFQEGMNFVDGGAFDTLTAQVRSNGVWGNVSNLVITPAYSLNNGINFETFELAFSPQTGDAIRIFGAPGGGAHFISVAELEIYGVDQPTLPGNAPPTADAGADQTANINAAVTLSGTGTDPESSPLNYAWSQLSGPSVALSNVAAPSLAFTAPPVPTTLVFQLVTNDGAQNSAADTVTVTVNDPNPSNTNLTAAGTPVAFITAPTGGGGRNLALMKDGVKPAVGSTNDALQYDTYNGGGARANDWFGYTFTSSKLFNRLVFQEGMNFVDGGAFTSLGVQLRNGGVWTDVSGVVATPVYAGANGVNFETFQLTFPGVSGDGIRISGTPAGSAHFTSIAELEVYGSDQAGPPPNLAPSANAGADQDVLLNAAVSLSGSGSDPEGAAITYLWSQIGGPVVTLSSTSAASPTFTAPAAATTLTFQLVTSDGTQSSPADSVFISVAPAVNLKPTANAGPDQSVNFSVFVTLNGSGSDPESSPISYSWSQIGGPVVALANATSASPIFTAPAVVTTLTFQLLTNDGTQDSVADSVIVTVNDPTPPSNVNITASGTPVAFITAPTGGGSRTLALIKDGVKPAVGSSNFALQYDTYNGGGARASDWVGYTFTSAKQFNRLVFQEGMNFVDGGAFTAASLAVQVRNGGAWSNVSGLTVTPAYPGLNTSNFETFTLNFTAVSGDGIRVFGTPAGSARFMSIAELEVYGSDTVGPPPNLAPSANAGADQNVTTNAVVTLSGSGTDPEGAAVTYVWSQIGGSAVTLSSTSTPSPTFTAPAAATTLTFQLVTNDGTQSSVADAVIVNVALPVNLMPTANAGPDQNVLTNAGVTLSGSGADPEGVAITYLWSQIGGPVVTLSSTTITSPTFTAPAATTSLTFQLVTSDGTQVSAADTVIINVNPPVNLKPTANAGPDQNVLTNAAVALSGSGADPEGTTITYLWSQVAGTAVTLSSPAVAAPTFTAPAAATTLTFQLVTSDGTQSSTADNVVINVTAPVNLKPTANAGPDQSVLTNAAVTLSGSGADPEGAAITYLWSQTGGTTVTLSNTAATAPTFTAPAAASTLTFQLLTSDGTQLSTADSVVITVSAPVNLAPTANAGPDQSVNFNASVTLSGSGADPEGATISYLWSQIGGPVVTLSSTTSASPTFTAPAVVTTLTFQLVTSDGTQGSIADSVIVTVNDPTPPSNVNLTASGTPVAFITAPTGGGSRNLALIKDGVKPAVGSSNAAQQYDTYNGGGARASDWFGYTFTSAKLFNRLVFQEGMNFVDGGGFTAGTLTVQVRNSGVWTNATGLTITPSYPGLNTTHFETYTLNFTAISGDGIRIFGTPAGAARFASIAELEVYGSNTAGPPPNLPPSADAGVDKSVSINAAVALSGSGADPEGAAITYQWTQIGGAVVTLAGPNTAAPTFTAPAVATTLSFELVTNDGIQSGTADTIDVVVTDPSAINLAASGTPVAFITAPTGGGSRSLAVIKDGVKPAVGSSNFALQYDTYNGGGARASDWLGYTFTSAKTFNRIVFQEGMNFVDGGGFTAGTLTVQVRNGGVWTTVGGLVTAPTYPALNGVNFESFQLSFTPVSGDGIRIFGTPAGSARFVSVAELEVYGN